MNRTTKPLCLVLLSLAALLAGCPKPLVRPVPSDTGSEPIKKANGVDGGIIIDPPFPPRPPDGPGPRDTTFDENGLSRSILQAQTVYFDFDKSTIKPSEVAKLQVALKYLNDNPGARLLLEGHCDWRGTADYNLGLGDRRAVAVKQYLEKLKVPADKLETLSKGSIGAPEKATEEQMSKDRRVELIVIKPKSP